MHKLYVKKGRINIQLYDELYTDRPTYVRGEKYVTVNEHVQVANTRRHRPTVTNSKPRAVPKSKDKAKWEVPKITGLNRVAIETMETTEASKFGQWIKFVYYSQTNRSLAMTIIQCTRRLILVIVLIGSRIRYYGDVPIIYTVLVFSLTGQRSPNVWRFRRFWWSLNVVHGSAVARITVMKVPGMSYNLTVDLDGQTTNSRWSRMAMAQAQLTTQARRYTGHAVVLTKILSSTTAPERAVLSVLSLGVALRTDESGASEAAETCIFLASIWLAFAGHVVLFWLWLPRRGRWTAPVDSEITEKDVRNVRDFSVKRLPSGRH